MSKPIFRRDRHPLIPAPMLRHAYTARAAVRTSRRAGTSGMFLAATLLATLLAMFVAGTTAASAQTPPDSAAFQYIQSVTFGTAPCDVCVPRVCPGEPVRVTVRGVLPSACVQFRGLRELPTAGPFPVIAADFVDLTCRARCIPNPIEFSGSIELGALSPGKYPLVMLEGVRACPDTSAVTIRSRQQSYTVVPECPPAPIPIDSLVRGFTSLRILPEQPCPGDTLTLQLLTNGCPPCLDLTGLFQTRVRGIVATMDWRPLCASFACMPETLSLVLGQFAAGRHAFTVDTDVHVRDTAKPDSVIRFLRTVRFAVRPDCDTTDAGCLQTSLPPRGTPVDHCAVSITPGGTGELLVPVRNDIRVPSIAGVEGWVTTFTPFRVQDIQYAGGAAGVHVSWRQDGERARFVLFGATPNVVPPGTSDLLRVTVALDSLVPPWLTFGSLHGSITLASDAGGQQVPTCPEPLIVAPQLMLCVHRDSASCDVNADGHADVRDLVLMVRCLRRSAPDTLGRALCFDCDHDGSFGIPDLFCCAHEILGGSGVPGDSAVVHSGLSVSMDPPVAEGSGVRVRVRVKGAAALGAALLRLRYPADRWRVTSPAGADAGFAAGWLPLIDDHDAGLLRVGALRLAESAAGELVYDLHAEPLDGMGAAGSLVVEGADLTSPDGAVYTPASALPSAELSPAPLAATIELSPARPNPFGRATSFTVSLPRDAAVELSVHDLAGRRIALLAQGRLAAGRRTFTWDGSGARDGLYFVRLSIAGRVLTTRVALLREGR